MRWEGHSLSIVDVGGRPAWSATQVAMALGYADPRDLAESIRGPWATELEAGVDFAEGALNTTVDDGHIRGRRRGRPGMALYESGLWAVTLLCRLPAGRRLRRWLATEVLPELHRTGTYTRPGASQAAPALDRTHALEVQVARLEGELSGLRVALAQRQLSMFAPPAPVRGREGRRAAPVAPSGAASPGGAALELVRQWVREACERDARARTRNADLQRSWSAWVGQRDVPEPAMRAVSVALAHLGYPRWRSGTCRGFAGLRLREVAS